jgi:hypothetical protein
LWTLAQSMSSMRAIFWPSFGKLRASKARYA